MASKIQSHNFYVAITPYKVQGVEDQYNELSVFTSYNEHVHKFYVSLQAGYTTTSGGHGSFIMGDQNPLTASTCVYVKESPRNSQKTINEIGAALELAKDAIVWLFDQRMWPELRQFVKDVALYGYTYDMEQRIKGYKGATKGDHELNELNENNNQNSETMAQNVKAADLIGKVIIIGGTSAKYVVKSIEGDKLQCDFVNDGKTTPMSVPVSQVQKFIADGKWTVETEEVRGKKEDVATDADVAEVDDIVPVVTKKPTPKAEEPKEEKPAAIVKPIETKPKAEPKPKAKTQTSKGTLTYETYQNKKGKTCAKIIGFGENDPAYVNAADLHGSATYERDKDGGKTFYLIFGPRYAEAAKKVCELLNAGKPIEDAIAIIDKATEERATKREEWKQKRAERAAATAEPKSSKEQAMFELFKKFMQGDKDAMAQVDAMVAKQAA